jgi:hypothetical protein
MPGSDPHGCVQLDLNVAEFQQNLFDLEKADRHSAMETLRKLLRMTWEQVYRDQGLKWEKIAGRAAPGWKSAVYSLRISQSRRAVACRDGNVMRLLSIAPDHDATYGKK